MDQFKISGFYDDENPISKTVKGAAIGLGAGSIWGAIVAHLYDAPPVESNAARAGLIRTFKSCGNYGLTLAALGGIYVGVEQLLLKKRMKRDYVNGAAGAFVAGASVLGFKGRRISSVVLSGAALAATSALLDFAGETTRIDVEKKPSTH